MTTTHRGVDELHKLMRNKLNMHGPHMTVLAHVSPKQMQAHEVVSKTGFFSSVDNRSKEQTGKRMVTDKMPQLQEHVFKG